MIQRFLDYVEIRTKITSLFAFLMSLAYLFYLGQPINWKRTGIFFVSMFLFDLATTAINNYVDTKTNRQVLQFQRSVAFYIILVLICVASVLGLVLALLTDPLVFLIGGACFLCGIFYTWGPLPISRQPLGEVFSGIFYGLLIPFLIFYINRPVGTYLTLDLSLTIVQLTFQLPALLGLLLLSAAPICATANIMLANNICDVEKDIAVKRHTLPYYLGSHALTLFSFLYYAIYFAAVMLVVFKVLPPIYLLFLLTIIPVQKNISRFLKKQEKETTFIISIKNFVIIMGMDTLLIFLCHWFQ